MGRIFAVGLGPGHVDGMTGEAVAALRRADIIYGYAGYIKFAQAIVPETPVIATGMRAEVDRCRQALAAAVQGKTVAVVCSGDAGVYGMAGLLYQLSENYPPVDIVVVSGVSAAMAGAAVLGAPLMHDFAVVSLSDLLTPWAIIESRLNAAAAAEFVLCLYNPASRKRHDYLARACDIILRHRPLGTVCGWTRNIGREENSHAVVSLGELRDFQADMFTTVFVGTGATIALRGKMVTSRGYDGLTE